MKTVILALSLFCMPALADTLAVVHPYNVQMVTGNVLYVGSDSVIIDASGYDFTEQDNITRDGFDVAFHPYTVTFQFPGKPVTLDYACTLDAFPAQASYILTCRD